MTTRVQRIGLPMLASLVLMTTSTLHADDAETRAVKAVEKHMGRITYGKLVVGEFAYDVVTEVHPVSCHMTDKGLKYLGAFKHLQLLNLSCQFAVTDAGLKELAPLKQLRSLNLSGTRVSDKGLKGLAGLKSLQTLSLYRTRVTDTGLKELAGLKSLQTLNLGFTPVTDAGVAELQKALPKLRIDRTPISLDFSFPPIDFDF